MSRIYKINEPIKIIWGIDIEDIVASFIVFVIGIIIGQLLYAAIFFVIAIMVMRTLKAGKPRGTAWRTLYKIGVPLPGLIPNPRYQPFFTLFTQKEKQKPKKTTKIYTKP